MVGALEVLRSAHPGGVVVCFSHAEPIKAAVPMRWGRGHVLRGHDGRVRAIDHRL
jgi:hypothetical protein